MGQTDYGGAVQSVLVGWLSGWRRIQRLQQSAFCILSSVLRPLWSVSVPVYLPDKQGTDRLAARSANTLSYTPPGSLYPPQGHHLRIVFLSRSNGHERFKRWGMDKKEKKKRRRLSRQRRYMQTQHCHLINPPSCPRLANRRRCGPHQFASCLFGVCKELVSLARRSL